RGAVRAIVFRRDGRVMATAGSDGSIRLWDVAARVQRGPPLRGSPGLLAIAFRRDGTLASVQANGTIKIWDLRTRKAVTTVHFDAAGGLNSASFDADGTRLAGVADKETVVWSLRGPTPRALPALPDPSSFHDQYSASALAPNGNLFAAGDDAERIKLWDLGGARP